MLPPALPTCWAEDSCTWACLCVFLLGIPCTERASARVSQETVSAWTLPYHHTLVAASQRRCAACPLLYIWSATSVCYKEAQWAGRQTKGSRAGNQRRSATGTDPTARCSRSQASSNSRPRHTAQQPLSTGLPLRLFVPHTNLLPLLFPPQRSYTRIRSNRGNPLSTIMQCTQNNPHNTFSKQSLAPHLMVSADVLELKPLHGDLPVNSCYTAHDSPEC